MIDDMHKEVDTRNLMLSPNQMICIPQFGGCTGNAFQKQKTVYLDHFDNFNRIYYVPESDNLKALKNIKNFIIMPMIGHDG